MRYTRGMTASSFRNLLAQLPQTLTRSEQADGLLELHEALRHLSVHGLVLSVREWFSQYPGINEPFEVSIEKIGKILPKCSPEMSDENQAAVMDLCQRLMLHDPLGEPVALTRLIMIMNMMKWDRAGADTVLKAVAQLEGRVDPGTLFAAADAERLQENTPTHQSGGHKNRL